MINSHRATQRGLGGVICGLALLLAAPAGAHTSYSYARVLVGPSTLIEANGASDSLEIHQPILVGDRVAVPYGSRLEVALSDGSLLRIAGGSELAFERLADSADTQDRRTILRLLRGEVQWVVSEGAFVDAPPRLAGPAASVDIRRAGTYRITVNDHGATELVVREGGAELVTERSSLHVRAGELAWAQGGGRSRFEVRHADDRDALELWGDRLTHEAALAEAPDVAEPLRYAAAPLARHGVWIDVGGRRAWHPRNAGAWRPYEHGYWRHTPVGSTWVSYDPWGWVTHHYGSWDYVAAHGWVWYPGPADWAPAKVVWYWGPSYVGWVPAGYYAHHYQRLAHAHETHHGSGPHLSIHGWAGFGWHHFGRWSFTATAHFGHRRHHPMTLSGKQLASRHAALERGIVTTRSHVGRRPAGEVYRTLLEEADRDFRQLGRDLPDVSDFVARKPLREEVLRTVLKPAAPRFGAGGLRAEIVEPRDIRRAEPGIRPPNRRRVLVRPGPRRYPAAATRRDVPGRRVAVPGTRLTNPDRPYRRPTIPSPRVDRVPRAPKTYRDPARLPDRRILGKPPERPGVDVRRDYPVPARPAVPRPQVDRVPAAPKAFRIPGHPGIRRVPGALPGRPGVDRRPQRRPGSGSPGIHRLERPPRPARVIPRTGSPRTVTKAPPQTGSGRPGQLRPATPRPRVEAEARPERKPHRRDR